MLTAAVLAAVGCLMWPLRPAVDCDGMDEPGGGPVATRRIRRVVDHLLRRIRPRRGRQAWVAEFAEVVAVGLDAGLDLSSAVLAAARSPGVTDPAPGLVELVAASVAEGHGVAGVMDQLPAEAEDAVDLRTIAAAWRLAEEVGAAASSVTAAAARSVRDRQAARERTAVVTAGPRASMWLLSALPLAAPVAGALVGMGPGRLYAAVPGRLLAATGVALTAGGWWWARRLLLRAQRPGRTDGRQR